MFQLRFHGHVAVAVLRSLRLGKKFFGCDTEINVNDESQRNLN